MRTRLPLVALVLAAVLAGCGTPGGDSGDNAKKAEEANRSARQIDVAKAGNVTLTIWDQEVRGGQAAQIKKLNAAFEAKYPNVTIKRTAKSFEDLQATLKLAVSGNKAPDVVEANQGRGVMVQLVKGGLLKPLDGFAKIFNWQDRWAKTLLDLNRFSPDGKTFAEFEQQLADAKSKGEVGIAFGNLDKWPGIHEFETVLGQTADKQQIRDFVFAPEGASFDTPEFQTAAKKIQAWAKAG